MTNKSKHAGLGIALGAVLGAVFGVLAGNMGVWLALGVVIGMVIGASFRRRPTDCPQCAQVHPAHQLRRQVGQPRQFGRKDGVVPGEGCDSELEANLVRGG